MVLVVLALLPAARLGHFAVLLLLGRHLLHDTESLPALAAQLVALQDLDGVVDRHGRAHVQLELLLLLLVRRRQAVLHGDGIHQLVTLLQLVLAILDEIVGHRELQHIRRQLQINQDIVEINVLRLVSIHEPGLDLQQAAHRAFQRLLDADPLLRVDHLHGDSCVRLRARECAEFCAKSYLVVALV